MKIELAKEHSSWCISCYQNYANYAIRMGMEPEEPGHVTSWKLFLCDPCLKELKAIEYPPKPRFQAESSTETSGRICNHGGASYQVTDTEFRYAVAGPLCFKCSHATADFFNSLNEAQ